MSADDLRILVETAERWHDPAERPPVDWGALERRGSPPARAWAMHDWIGFYLTLLIGLGGMGKTLIAQQVASCLAISRGLMGRVDRAYTTLLWACEDEHDELWRRQVDIGHWLEVPLSAFAKRLVIQPRLGLDNTMYSVEYGKAMVTPLLEELTQQVNDYRAEVVFLDNVAQLFGGNENDRHQVTSFVNALCGALPGKAIVLLAHPSRQAGSEYSGSSAWENAARMRLYLGNKLPDQPQDEEPSDDVRFLAKRKANYTGADYRKFTYQNGVLIPDPLEVGGGMMDRIRKQRAEGIVTKCASETEHHGRANDRRQDLPRIPPAHRP